MSKLLFQPKSIFGSKYLFSAIFAFTANRFDSSTSSGLVLTFRRFGNVQKKSEQNFFGEKITRLFFPRKEAALGPRLCGRVGRICAVLEVGSWPLQ